MMEIALLREMPGKLGSVNTLTYVLEVEGWGLDDASDVGLSRGKGQRVILGFQL